jgi:Cu(I)/Ag(I) efflux system membrane protein CusA/SilA
MVGGMITAPLLSMFVIPAAYSLIRRSGWHRRLVSQRKALQPAPS